MLFLDNNRRHAFLAWTITGFENIDQKCYFWITTEGTLSWPEQSQDSKKLTRSVTEVLLLDNNRRHAFLAWTIYRILKHFSEVSLPDDARRHSLSGLNKHVILRHTYQNCYFREKVTRDVTQSRDWGVTEFWTPRHTTASAMLTKLRMINSPMEGGISCDHISWWDEADYNR